MYSICVIASNERNFSPEGNIGSLFLDAGHTMGAFLAPEHINCSTGIKKAEM